MTSHLTMTFPKYILYGKRSSFRQRGKVYSLNIKDNHGKLFKIKFETIAYFIIMSNSIPGSKSG